MVQDGSVNAGDHQRLLSLFAQKARLDQEIDAQLATLQPSVAFPTPQTSCQTSPSLPATQHEAAESLATTGHPMTRGVSSRSQHVGSSLMNGARDAVFPSSKSLQCSQNLTRTVNQICQDPLMSYGEEHTPFGSSAPWQNEHSFGSWRSAQDDPFCTIASPGHSHMFSWQSAQNGPFCTITPPSHSSDMPLPQSFAPNEVDEVFLQFGEDPLAYLGRTTSLPAFSMHPTPGTAMSPFPMTNIGECGEPRFNGNHPTSPCSSSLTTGTSFEDEMSRQDSLVSEYPRALPMLAINSSRSCYSDYDQSSCQFQPKFPSDIDQNRLLFGAGDGLSAQISMRHTTSQPCDFDAEASDMKRSASSKSDVSTSSTSSTTSRAKVQLARAIQLASRALKPKAELEPKSIDVGLSGLHTLSKEDEESSRASRVSAYIRPKHKRVSCDKCPERPDFRGRHELSRHNLSKHSTVVKRFVCVEPSVRDASTLVRPAVPMHKCKSCMEGKQYNIYYNAAAHLRRFHFAPRTKTRGRSKKGSLKPQEKVIKANNEWPKMEDLKPWLQEILVTRFVEGVTNDNGVDDEEGLEMDNDDDVDEDEQFHATCDEMSIEEHSSDMPSHSGFGIEGAVMADFLPGARESLSYPKPIPAPSIHKSLPQSGLTYGGSLLLPSLTHAQSASDLRYGAYVGGVYMGNTFDLSPSTPYSSDTYDFAFDL